MKKLLYAVLFTSYLSSAVAAPVAKKVDRWTELMTLVSQEMKILENAKRKGPELYTVCLSFTLRSLN